MKMIIVFMLFATASSLKETPIKRLPQMVVFDIDCALWPSWKDNRVFPPFSVTPRRYVSDSKGKLMKYHTEALKVLKSLKHQNIRMSIISKTKEGKHVRKLLSLFGLNYFVNNQLYPDEKTRHLTWISRLCNVEFKDMLLFDHENSTADVVKSLDVITILLPRTGITRKLLKTGLNTFSSIRLAEEQTITNNTSSATDV